ncbi:MAG TPA: HAMP domain-containing sensor histidine kinase, partial [Arenibacter sp.]|nr:HAMP domain-containing sensor histidine kinase [Arenibacter sp.]
IALKKSDFENVDIDRAPFFSKLPKVNIRKDVTKTLNGTAISSEIYFQGQIYTVNSTPLYSEQKEIIWALFVYNNVTEQKRVQQNLEKTLKAEQELNDLKSRFVSMASHEFRTPLSAILSSAILIGKQNGPGMEERREKHVSRIRNSVKSLVLILNDFLSMEILEEGRIKVDPKQFELIQFSKLLIEEMEGHKKEGQYISLDHPRMDILVYMDANALGHILINLLSNALKYSKEGQEISMKISRTSNEVLITVTDKGMGIPQEEQKKLFERFFRAANVANIQGTGLGLHIVKQYTELLGGAISFTSKMGIGTSFTIKLPLKSQPPRT